MNLTAFEESLLLEGLREYTIEGHLGRVKYLLRACHPLTEEAFRSFILGKIRDGRKLSSLNRLILTLRRYAQFADMEWGLKYPLLKDKEVPEKQIFSDEEIEKIIDCPMPAKSNRRSWDTWSMFFRVLAFTGMRASEVATLTVDQVDWGTNNLILPKTKTIPRRVPIASVLKEPLKEFCLGKTGYLFPDYTPRGHIWRQTWGNKLRQRKKLLGITRSNLTCHSFRHSFISNLWEEAVPLPDIMGIVGHRKAETTLGYSHLGDRSRQKSINKHSLVKKHADPIDQLESLIEEARKAGLLNSDQFTWKIDRKSLHIEIVERK